jgi:DNA mismatch endonuclease, patch repair protein
MSYMPKSNVEFWKKKLEGNVRRDAENTAKLTEMGWKVFNVWECQIISDVDNALSGLVTYLDKV